MRGGAKEGGRGRWGRGGGSNKSNGFFTTLSPFQITWMVFCWAIRYSTAQTGTFFFFCSILLLVHFPLFHCSIPVELLQRIFDNCVQLIFILPPLSFLLSFSRSLFLSDEMIPFALDKFPIPTGRRRSLSTQKLNYSCQIIWSWNYQITKIATLFNHNRKRKEKKKKEEEERKTWHVWRNVRWELNLSWRSISRADHHL